MDVSINIRSAIKGSSMDDTQWLNGDELLALARIDLADNKLEAALVKLRRAERIEPQRPDVLFELARVHARLALRDAARAGYQRVLAAQPDHLLARFESGMVEFDDDRLDEAERIWGEVLAVEPGYPPAEYFNALIVLRRGGTEAARQLLRGLVDKLPTDNLYAERARKLLQTLDRVPSAQGSQAPGLVEMAAYKTEH